MEIYGAVLILLTHEYCPCHAQIIEPKLLHVPYHAQIIEPRFFFSFKNLANASICLFTKSNGYAIIENNLKAVHLQ